jgi:hypothetical protein
MSPDEYNMYAYGYFMRLQVSQVPFRKLYQLLYNVNAARGKQISSIGSLSQHWPLPMVDKESGAIISRDTMQDIWKRVHTKKREREKINHETGT